MQMQIISTYQQIHNGGQLRDSEHYCACQLMTVSLSHQGWKRQQKLWGHSGQMWRRLDERKWGAACLHRYSEPISDGWHRRLHKSIQIRPPGHVTENQIDHAFMRKRSGDLCKVSVFNKGQTLHQITISFYQHSTSVWNGLNTGTL